MRTFTFDPTQSTPVVSGLLTGPKGTRRVPLVFDTGAVLTQIHTPTLQRLGYDSSYHVREAVMLGASGERHEGALIESEKLFTLGRKIEKLVIGSFDFSDLAEAGIDGLLGWDVISALHLEMDGPGGILKVF